jgi:hypothetical protein
MEVLIMNKKCFCCFNNMNKNDNNDELLQDWMEFRFEKLESNLNDEDRKHALKYDTFCEKILDVIQDRDSNYISNVLDDFREEMLNHCVYWNEKYYMTGVNDVIKFITNTLNS